MSDTSHIRRSYERGSLDDPDVRDDPMATVVEWIDEAVHHPDVHEPTAMTLATVSPEGVPSARMVLLKGCDPDRGTFRFFTGRDSRKAHDLLATGRAALAMWWDPLERQVRIVGTVAELSRSEVASYFAARPRGSQLGAAASHQSFPVASRRVLDEQLATVARTHPEGSAVPVPDAWTGFELAALEIELWHGRPGRMHDRICYRRLIDGRPSLSLPDGLEQAWHEVEGGAVVVDDPHGGSWLRARLQP